MTLQLFGETLANTMLQTNEVIEYRLPSREMTVLKGMLVATIVNQGRIFTLNQQLALEGKPSFEEITEDMFEEMLHRILADAEELKRDVGPGTTSSYISLCALIVQTEKVRTDTEVMVQAAGIGVHTVEFTRVLQHNRDQIAQLPKLQTRKAKMEKTLPLNVIRNYGMLNQPVEVQKQCNLETVTATAQLLHGLYSTLYRSMRLIHSAHSSKVRRSKLEKAMKGVIKIVMVKTELYNSSMLRWQVLFEEDDPPLLVHGQIMNRLWASARANAGCTPVTLGLPDGWAGEVAVVGPYTGEEIREITNCNENRKRLLEGIAEVASAVASAEAFYVAATQELERQCVDLLDAILHYETSEAPYEWSSDLQRGREGQPPRAGSYDLDIVAFVAPENPNRTNLLHGLVGLKMNRSYDLGFLASRWEKEFPPQKRVALFGDFDPVGFHAPYLKNLHKKIKSQTSALGVTVHLEPRSASSSPPVSEG
jgi:hypothetical protein